MSSEQKPKNEPASDSPVKAVGAKKSFVLRIDEGTYKALEHWAADEFRSVNGQMEWLIDQALKTAGRAKKPRADGAA